MPDIESLFPTLVYRARIETAEMLNYELETAALALAKSDRTGQRWCERHGYRGYTSYGSNLDLAAASKPFARLVTKIDRHAARFAKALHWQLRGNRPCCDSLWVNVMADGSAHSGHLHTNAVLSGTYYVAVPEGSAPIVFEDPRLAMLMAAPPRRANAPKPMRHQVSETPVPGTLLLWESWLRHEVPANRNPGNRISVSFNYVIAAPENR